MSPEPGFTLDDVARTVVAYHAVHGTCWADGPGRAHWIVLWKVPAARARAAANDEAWDRFRTLMADLQVPDRLPELDRRWVAAEARRLDPVIAHLAGGRAGHPTPLGDWALRRSASILGSAYRNLRRRDDRPGRGARQGRRPDRE